MSGLPSQRWYSVWLWTVHPAHWIVRPLVPWHSDFLHEVLSLAVLEQYTSAMCCRPATIFQVRTVRQALNCNILEEESYWFKYAKNWNKYRKVQQQAPLTWSPMWNHLRRLLETCQTGLNVIGPNVTTLHHTRSHQCLHLPARPHAHTHGHRSYIYLTDDLPY
jgi:hypothetical protein